MYTNDYILRMIEQLVAGIAQIMGLRKENKIEECAETLSGTLRRFFGLSDETLEALPYEDLIALSSLGGLRDSVKCALLAQLIGEKAGLERMKGREEAAASLTVKALCIFISALLADCDLNTPANREEIDGLADEARAYDLPMEAKRLLFEYEERTGRFGRAEDALYDMLKTDEGAAETSEAGEAFYLRLMGKEDAELIAGNLPRDEVADGLLRLRNRREGRA